MARRLGATDAQLEALARDDRSPFSPSWAAALAYAGAVTEPSSAVSDEMFAELARHWTSAQIVEITSVIALFNYFNRFAQALHIPITR